MTRTLKYICLTWTQIAAGNSQGGLKEKGKNIQTTVKVNFKAISDEAQRPLKANTKREERKEGQKTCSDGIKPKRKKGIEEGRYKGRKV